MSRGYRIQLPDARPLQRVERSATGADELKIDVSLLPILPGPEMARILREELAKDGWKPESGGSMRKQLGDGLVATLSEDGCEVTVSSTSTRTVVGHGASVSAAEAAARDRAAGLADQARRDSTVKLSRAEADVRAEIEVAVQRVYVGALTARAQQMGRIESLVEGTAADGTQEITIKVRV